MKNVFIKTAGIALVVATLMGAVPAKAQTPTAESLLALIAQLQAQIASLTASLNSNPATTASFNVDLTLGSQGVEVVRLQDFLISRGFLTMPAGTAKGYFGQLTKSALASFQAANGISPAAGYFGPATRTRVNAMVGPITVPPTNPNPTPTDTNGGLSGGAGSVEDYTLITGLNNEEVGERQKDVEVAGLEIEADRGSDLRITSVRLVFDEVNATDDFEDYADEVSVLLNGREVARVDADEFNDNNNWTKSVTLKGNNIIRAGQTGDLVVAVSGARSIDSGNIGQSWSVDFRQIRFVDAQGATITEDPGTQTRTFSFESFATAADLKVRIKEKNDTINDSHIISVDQNNDTDKVDLLSFTIAAEGNSDIVIDSIPFAFQVTGATNVDDLISTVYLFADGREIGSANVGSGLGADETIVIDDLDYTIDAKDTVDFVVKADFNSVSDALDEGDTISVEIGENETDSANFDIEDQTGEDVSDEDINGSANAGPHAVYDTGIQVKFIDSKSQIIDEEHNQVSFTFTFDVTAFGDDVYLDSDLVADATPTSATDGNAYATTSAASTGEFTSSLLYSATGRSGDTEHAYIIEEGRTRRFVITIAVSAGAQAGYTQVEMTGLKWGTSGSTDTSADRLYNFNIDDFVSEPVFLVAN